MLGEEKIEFLTTVHLQPSVHDPIKGSPIADASLGSPAESSQTRPDPLIFTHQPSLVVWENFSHVEPHVQGFAPDFSSVDQLLNHYINAQLIDTFQTRPGPPTLAAHSPTMQPSSSPSQSPTYHYHSGKTRKRKTIPKRNDFDKGCRSKSETGYRGVRFSTNGYRFRATVNVDKKSFNVGTFDSATEAAQEYDKALIRITKGTVERSRLNFPNKWNHIYRDFAACRNDTTDFPPAKRRKVAT